METRLDLLRKLLAEPDSADLQTQSGKRRGFVTIYANCTTKMVDLTARLRLGRPSKPQPGFRRVA